MPRSSKGRCLSLSTASVTLRLPETSCSSRVVNWYWFMAGYIFCWGLQSQLRGYFLHGLKTEIKKIRNADADFFTFTDNLTVGAGGEQFFLVAFTYRFGFDARQFFVGIHQGSGGDQTGDGLSGGKGMVELLMTALLVSLFIVQADRFDDILSNPFLTQNPGGFMGMTTHVIFGQFHVQVV